MASSSKRGSVVLIEAFVVLCLMFVLQYILAGIAEQSSAASRYDKFVEVEVVQAETAGNKSNHFAYAQIGEHYLSMGGTDNCPLPTEPWNYHFVSGETAKIPENARMKAPGQIVIAGKQVEDVFNALNPVSLATAKQVFSLEGITVDTIPGQTTSSPNLLISYAIRPDQTKQFQLRIFMCICDLPPATATPEKEVKFPHPLLVSVFREVEDGAVINQFAGYYHFKQDANANVGLLYVDHTMAVPGGSIKPLKMYMISISPTGDLATWNLDPLKEVLTE
jgi:hypothetical protein